MEQYSLEGSNVFTIRYSILVAVTENKPICRSYVYLIYIYLHLVGINVLTGKYR